MPRLNVARIFVLLLLGALFVAVACDDDDDDDAADFSLVSSGKLTICTDSPYQPFEFQDDDGEFTGFDMDLLRSIADGLNLELSVKVVPFDGI